MTDEHEHAWFVIASGHEPFDSGFIPSCRRRTSQTRMGG